MKERIALWICDIVKLTEVFIKVVSFRLVLPDWEFKILDWLDAHFVKLWVSGEELIASIDEEVKAP